MGSPDKVPPRIEVGDIHRLHEIQKRQVELLMKHRAAFFTPNGVQEEFIKMPQVARDAGRFPEKTVKVFLWSAANDVGKTRDLAEIGRCLSVGVANKWFDMPFYRDFPRPNRGRMISTKQALEEGLIVELGELLREELAPGYPKKDGKQHDSVWVMQMRDKFTSMGSGWVSRTGGSRFDLYTWDQAVTQHAGAFLQWLILDEPGKKGVYKEAIARLRRGGPVYWGLTPYDETGGLKQDLVWLFNEMQDSEESGSSMYQIMYADAEDNCEIHGVRGRVPHITIQDRYNRWSQDPDELRARFTGRFVQEEGRVFKGFKPEHHVIEPIPIGPEFERYGALDHHPEKPEYYLQCAWSPHGDLYVTHEIIEDRGVDETARQLKELWSLEGKPHVPLIDPLAEVKNKITMTAPVDRYRDFGVVFRPAGPEKAEKDTGISRIKQMLKLQPNGKPRIFIFNTCTRLIWEMKRLNIDPKTQKPAKVDDDMVENLYRICNQIPKETKFQEDRRSQMLDTYVSPLMGCGV